MKSSFHIKDKLSPWWQPKVALLLAQAYLSFIIVKAEMFPSFLFVFLFALSALGFGIGGHIINDITDAPHDKLNKKANIFNNYSANKIGLISIACLLLAIVPWYFLKSDVVIVTLLFSEFLCFVIYSIKPFRLKEKGVAGVIADATYGYALPSVLIFYAALLFFEKPVDWVFLTLLALWNLFIGIHNIIIHQIEDYENDVNTKTKTWVTQRDKQRARKILFIGILPIHLLLFGLFALYVDINYVYFYASFILLFLTFKIYKTLKWKSYRFFLHSRISADLQNANIHYHYFLPYWHLTLLVFLNPYFIFLLVTHYAVFNYQMFVSVVIRPTFLIISNIISSFRHFISVIVNYSIFYFRILFLFESPEKARREHYYEYAKHQSNLNSRLCDKNIVVANINLNKYTETFVNKHIDILKQAGFLIHQLYGGNLPTAELNEGTLLGNDIMRKYFEWKELIYNLPENYYIKKAVKDFLVKKNIALVVAEFGTCGVELYEICREIEIPLIVIFHGYDIHRSDVLQQNSERYREMFAYASKIIGVSHDILNKLKEVGAEEEKLLYLPCSFDVDIFRYNNHSENPPIFLSTGRFAETKSPHLIILAFNEVLKKIPNARLRMIGKNGGGELFEACHILVRALKIEDKVDFLGILPPYEVYEEMKNARVFVQHSLTTPIYGDKEGTPVAIMEAMACGLPVVATQHAGIAELIQSGNNGILVKEYDYLTMAKEMVRISNDDDLVFSLGKNAAESIMSNFFIAEDKNILAEIIEKHRLKNTSC